MKNNNTNNVKPNRFFVVFPGYSQDNEEQSQNFVSYSTQLDSIPGMTSAYSMACDAANRYSATIYTQDANGDYKEVKRKAGKE